MANTSALYVRIDTEVKEKAGKAIPHTASGISPTSAIRCFTARLLEKCRAV